MPVVNAVFDLISLGFSQLICKKILSQNNKSIYSILKFIFALIIDFILRLFLLIFISVSIPTAISLVNHFLPIFGIPAFEWKPFVKAIEKDPMGQGVFAVLLVWTMLIPTIIHMFAVAFLIFLFPWRESSFSNLSFREVNIISSPQRIMIFTKIIILPFVITFFIFPLAAIFIGNLFWAFMVVGIGQTLPELALYAGDLVSNFLIYDVDF